jgi:ribosomal protein L15
VISRPVLEQAGLLRRGDSRPAKLLSHGEIAVALRFDGIHCSRPARLKIEAAGGSFSGVEMPALAEVTAAEAADAGASEN